MKIAFRKNATKINSKLICWWTSSIYSHCEIVFENGLSFSADIEVMKTRFKTVVYDPNEWDIITIPIERIVEYKVYDFCLDEDNCGYDLYGMICTQVLYLSFESPYWWFCSELAYKCLQIAGLIPDTISYEVDPGKLFNILIEAIKEIECHSMEK